MDPYGSVWIRMHPYASACIRMDPYLNVTLGSIELTKDISMLQTFYKYVTNILQTIYKSYKTVVNEILDL